MAEERAENRTSWPRITEDGVEWEARIVSAPGQADAGDTDTGEEVLEFVCVSGERKTRRLAVREGSLPEMSEEQLHRAFVQARPIGGDHYGRPGKHTNDAL